ncbi:hypothetical protein ZHAS_00015858 [Anopheles sinensis]|uniref:Uncharacterized protein n=1 Tax=Anopheles sinensis TaxID=74873 RepID=A0A084WC41_ANOSI|nr:hypothetical protein ZHAS_00015858 [Anopheles sinensis]
MSSLAFAVRPLRTLVWCPLEVAGPSKPVRQKVLKATNGLDTTPVTRNALALPDKEDIHIPSVGRSVGRSVAFPRAYHVSSGLAAVDRSRKISI